MILAADLQVFLGCYGDKDANLPNDLHLEKLSRENVGLDASREKW